MGILFENYGFGEYVINKCKKLLRSDDLICKKENFKYLPQFAKHISTYSYDDKAFPILCYGSNSKTHNMIKFGISYYSIKNNPSLTFVLIDCGDLDVPSVLLVTKKGELWKILKSYRKFNTNRLLKETIKPILKDNLLDTIIKSTVWFLNKNNLRIMSNQGVKVKRGVVFAGPPGNGKSMVCDYLLAFCSAHNLSWTKVTNEEINRAYNNGILNKLLSSSSVMFFDDIDISFFCRKSSIHSGLACSLLSAMDGIEDRNHVVRIFSTNENINDFDDAFMRPGRIDTVFVFDKPISSLRRELIQTWDIDIRNTIKDTDNLVKITEGLSFAELEEIKCQISYNMLLGNSIDVEKIFRETFNKGKENKKRVGFEHES